MGAYYPSDDHSFRKQFMMLRGPGYYDSPEGTAPWEKLWGINKYAILSASMLSLGDCFFISQSRNILETMNVIGFYMVPAVSVASTFAAITYISTNLRGKDDRLNYCIGALGCIPVLHAVGRNRQSFTIPATIALVVAAFLKKDSLVTGWSLANVGTPKTEHYYDFSLVGTITEWPKRPY